MMENLLTITIQAVHSYLIDFGKTKLLVDAGWPGTLARLKSELKSLGIAPSDINYVLATHFHPDHAGLVQEIKRDFGARLILHQRQISGIAELQAFYAKKSGSGYQPVQVEKGDLLLKSAADDNRAALRAAGLQGAIAETPGHSEDSITLVLDSGRAFTGDLHPPDYSIEDAHEKTCQSWRKLIDMQVMWFYPAHANPIPASVIKEQLDRCS